MPDGVIVGDSGLCWYVPVVRVASIYSSAISLFFCFAYIFASDSSDTVKAIIIKLGTVTASDMIMHHVLMILTLTFIQGNISKMVKIINVQLFQKLFKQCPSGLLWPTKGLYNIISVRWPCSSRKVTTASQTWQVFNFTIIAMSRTILKLLYSILAWR